MRQAMAYLGVLIAFAAAGACGGCSAESSQPSLRVDPGATYTLPDGAVQLFTLKPSGRPTCTITLSSVRDGHVWESGSSLRETMTSAGSIAVVTRPRGVEIAWLIPPYGGGNGANFAAGSVSDGTAWASAVLGQGKDAGVQILWDEGRYPAHEKHSAMNMTGALGDLVSYSKQYPAETFHVVTIQLGGQ
jgi:hypothetical protein